MLLHFSVSLAFPGQNSFAELSSLDFNTHSLVLSCEPPPHVTEHLFQDDHCDHDGHSLELHILEREKKVIMAFFNVLIEIHFWDVVNIIQGSVPSFHGFTITLHI